MARREQAGGERAGASEGGHPYQGRALVPGDQASVRDCVDSLPRTDQKHGAVGLVVRAGQSGVADLVAGVAGMGISVGGRWP